MPDTPEIAAIRQRDARWDGRGYQIRTKRDRRALLAHIDALTAAHKECIEQCCRCCPALGEPHDA